MHRILVVLLVTAVAFTARRAEALTLDECERASLARAPAAHAALAAARAAGARVEAARGAYWPKLAFKGEYGVAGGYDVAVTNGGQTDALVALEAILLDGGARRARIGAALANLRSMSAKAAQQRADVVFAVRSAYFQAVTAGTSAAIDSDDARIVRAYVSLLEGAERRGLVPHTDVLRARLAVETAETARRASESDAKTARAAVAILTGLDVGENPLEEPHLEFSAATPDRLDRAPVVVDARAASESARQEADVVRTERASQVRLTADTGALGVHPRTTFEDDAGAQFMLSYVKPIFDGGVVAAHVAEAEAAARAAEHRIAEAQQGVELALSGAEADAHRADADLAAGQRAVPIASEQLDLMRARYLGGGNVRLLEVLDAVSVYADARHAVSRARLAYWTAIATQAQVLGESPE